MGRNVAMALVALFVLSAAASVLSACNTISGVGEDVAAAGRALSGAADETRKKF